MRGTRCWKCTLQPCADYDGIVYYAYARADARPGLEPVHRLWSPVRQRHFYTIHPSEKDAVLAESPKDAWTYEGIAFYAFAEGRQPPEAVPVPSVLQRADRTLVGDQAENRDCP